LTNAYCTIRNSVIQNSNSKTTDSGFFRIQALSKLKILDNTLIRNISGYWYGLLTGLTNSTLIISNNVTVANIKSNAGISFMLRSSPNVTISQALFTEHDEIIFEFKEA
jgi:hypothetical protein